MVLGVKLSGPSVLLIVLVGRLDVDGQSFAPIGLHKTDAASDWLLMKWHCIGTNAFPEAQLQK